MALIARHPFGTLVTVGDDGFPHASHIPMLAQPCDEGFRLIGHVARANPHAAAIARGTAATAVFRGPHAYVSPSWYERPTESVPTWNYVAKHCYGHLREVDARPVVAQLVRTFESRFPKPWLLDAIDPQYFEGQLRGIVAFELPVGRFVSSAKLSQNHSQIDRDTTIAALAASADPTERACADAMQDPNATA